MHTLGNLTLTGYNAEYSDRSFNEKRDMNGGFRESPLRVNEGLRELDTWDEDAIRARAERLASKAVDVWTGPSISPEVLNSYRDAAKVRAIRAHTDLDERSPMRLLFEEFRKDVLALDPCVTEEFFRPYVAYKAETNFLEVAVRASRLRLALNMQFHDLQDPRELAYYVAGLPRWSNRDVQVELRRQEELPYVMGLVRQALEKQLGNGDLDS